MTLITFLAGQPLILLFLVAAIGYPLGYLKIGGGTLGVAAVLFVGLAFGALDERLKLPEILYQAGLVLFVYCIGLSSGKSFFRSLRSGGLRDNLLVVVMLGVAAALALAVDWLLGLTPAQTAGLYAGSLTNTPALAAVVESISHTANGSASEALLNQPVVGYSIAYPMGVLGMILAITLTQRWWKPNYVAEAKHLRHLGAGAEELISRTIRVTQLGAIGKSVDELLRNQPWRVIFSRHRRNGEMTLVTGTTQLAEGDQITVVGVEEEIAQIAEQIGTVEAETLTLDRSHFDFRSIFVSNPAVVGRKIRDLDLQSKFGALVTRVRRGDIELLASGNSVLEAGDRVRVVTLRERMGEVSDYFGDSYRALSEIDILTFSLGIVIGLLIGQIPLSIPGGGVFRLGIAGGPLIVALILGALERTGSLVWNIPYSANLTLRQFGVVLFLAVIGTRAGYAFASTLVSSGGVLLFAGGALITCVTALLLLWVGHKLLRIPMSLLIGILAGLQTNPAVLSFAAKQTDNDLPNVGYTTVYPAAMIGKILLAQVLLSVARG